MHDTPVRKLGRVGVLSIVQLAPFQASANAWGLPVLFPTAVQALADVHDIA